MSCTIAVISHKPTAFAEDKLYLPLQVGKGISFCRHRDNTGDHIAQKNNLYCELTGLYWVWKNLENDYLGICHYRRYFSCGSLNGIKNQTWDSIAAYNDIMMELERYQILLPRKRHYYITNRKSHFIKAHGTGALHATQSALYHLYPEYGEAWETSMARSSGHIYNMCIMRKDLLHEYCQWLFPLLFQVEDILERQNQLSPRLMGFIGERLLDVWLEKHQYAYKELPCVFLEKINWPKKIWEFTKRTVV